jgi:nucleotide-binding universal stress UspA family protein
MNEVQSKSVVVGVDGSQAGINAARWAVAEALTRQVPLRIVHVVRRSGGTASTRLSEREIERGERALDQATVAVQEISKHVEVETVLLVGDPDQVLIDESQDAALICVGTDRRGWAAGKLLGTTEAALATRSRCPVAIVRTNPDGTPAVPGVIAVVLDDEPDNDDVVHYAMEEGRRRNAAVRQIDRRIDSWVRRYPDVPVEVVAAGAGPRNAEYFGKPVGLAVVGEADAAAIADLAVPNAHPIVGYPECSVLLVRH